MADVGEVALLFLVGFEVGLVPAAALQPKRRRGHQPLQRRLFALGTILQRFVRHLLQGVERMPATRAAVFVDWHDYRSLAKIQSRSSNLDGLGCFQERGKRGPATVDRIIGRSTCRGEGIFYAAAALALSNSRPPPADAAIRIVSPGAKSARRIRSASGFSTCCWIARFSGRAP